MKRSHPISQLTPEYPFFGNILGYNIFSNGTIFTMDDRVSETEHERILDYLIDEGFIDEDGDWIFLT